MSRALRPNLVEPADRGASLLQNSLLHVAASILLVETAVMMAVAVFRPETFILEEAALHVSFVTLCCSVLLYFWMLRPLEIRLFSTHMELESARARAEHLSRVDSLTGVANRRTFFEQFERDWDRSSRYGTPLSCIMVDLDLFKHLNDTHGHLMGDMALRRMGQLLRKMGRSSDSICRYGGEEFCLLLPETTEREAADFAERIRRAITADPVQWDGQEIFVTGSFGVAQRDREMNLPDNLVELADRALMRSKREGRNRVTRSADLNGDVGSADVPSATVLQIDENA